MSEPDGPADEQRGPDGGELEGAAEEEESPFLIIDVEEAQSRRRIEALRDGEGPLAESLFEVLEDLYAQGYVGEEVQPVVFVVRERDSSEEE